MLLNELNKSNGMLVRNLFGEGKRRNKCRGEEKGSREKEEIECQNKEKTILEIILNLI